MTKSFTGPTEIPSKRHAVVVYPESKEGQAAPTADATKKLVMERVNPAEGGWKIAGVRSVAKAGVFISTPSAKDAEDILKHPALSRDGLRVEPARSDLPRVKIFDVPLSFNAETLVTAIHRQNLEDMQVDDFQKQCRVVTLTPNKTRVSRWLY